MQKRERALQVKSLDEENRITSKKKIFQKGVKFQGHTTKNIQPRAFFSGLCTKMKPLFLEGVPMHGME